MPRVASRVSVLLCIFCSAWFAMPQTRSAAKASGRDTGATAVGKQTFLANCSACHGLDGSGGERAPSIASGSDAAKLSSGDLKRIVTSGISGAGMPPFSSLGAPRIDSVVAYVRELQGKGSAVQIPGNPERGSALFFGKAGCANCHLAAGKGGFIAADLTAYGQGRAPGEIREAITAPGSDPDQRTKQAEVVTRDGGHYRGIVRTEDNFSLALQTLDAEFVLIQKANVADIEYSLSPLMPTDYASKLTTSEMNDVVSFLMGLKPDNDPSAAKKRSKRNWEDDD